LSKKNEKKDNEIYALRLEINNLKQVVKSYEDQNLKLAEMEKKLKNQNIKFDKQIKQIEDKYKERIKSYQDKLRSFDNDDEDRVNVRVDI
jgi:hypothetical protein